MILQKYKKGEMMTLLLMLATGVSLFGLALGYITAGSNKNITTTKAQQYNSPYIADVQVTEAKTDHTNLAVKLCAPAQFVGSQLSAKIYVTGDQVNGSPVFPIILNRSINENTDDYISLCHTYGTSTDSTSTVIRVPLSSVDNTILCSGINLKVFMWAKQERFDFNSRVLVKDATACTITPSMAPTGNTSPQGTPTPTLGPQSACVNTEYLLNSDTVESQGSKGYTARDLNVPGQVVWGVGNLIEKDTCHQAVSSIGDTITEYYCGAFGRTSITKPCSESDDPSSRVCITDSKGRGYCTGAVATVTPTPSPTTAASANHPPTVVLVAPNSGAVAGSTVLLKMKGDDQDASDKIVGFKVRLCQGDTAATASNCNLYDQTTSPSVGTWTPPLSSEKYAKNTEVTLTVSDLPDGKKYFWKAASSDGQAVSGDVTDFTTTDVRSFTIDNSVPSNNQAPVVPTSLSPGIDYSSSTNTIDIPQINSRTPELNFQSTDSNSSDYILYTIKICTTTSMDGSSCTEIKQTLSSPSNTTGAWQGTWSGMDAQTNQAYRSGTQAKFQISSTTPFTYGSTYYWQVKATDNWGAASNWSGVKAFKTGGNQNPHIPTLSEPAPNASIETLNPLFTMVTQDDEGDMVRYYLQLCKESSTVGQADTANCVNANQDEHTEGWIFTSANHTAQTPPNYYVQNVPAQFRLYAPLPEPGAQPQHYLWRVKAHDNNSSHVGTGSDTAFSNWSAWRPLTVSNTATALKKKLSGTVTGIPSDKSFKIELCTVNASGTDVTDCGLNPKVITSTNNTFSFDGLSLGTKTAIKFAPNNCANGQCDATSITNAVLTAVKCPLYLWRKYVCIRTLNLNAADETQDYTFAVVTPPPAPPTPAADKRLISGYIDYHYPTDIDPSNVQMRIILMSRSQSTDAWAPDGDALVKPMPDNGGFIAYQFLKDAGSIEYSVKFDIWAKTDDGSFVRLTQQPTFTKDCTPTDSVATNTQVTANDTRTFCSVHGSGSATFIYKDVYIDNATPGFLADAAAAEGKQYDLNNDNVITVQDFRLGIDKWCVKTKTGGCAMKVSKLITFLGYKIKQN